MDWEVIGRVKLSKYRVKILKLLEKPSMPRELKEKTNYNFSHVSRALDQLEKMNLIECLTPNVKIGRMYQITEKGKKVLEKLKELDEIDSKFK